MKTTTRFVLFLPVLFWSLSSLSAGDVLLVGGAVSARAAGASEFSPLSEGDSVGRGTAVHTGGGGSAALSLMPRTSLSLDEETAISIERLRPAAATVRLEQGRLLVDLPRRSGLDFVVLTPMGEIQVTGTSFSAAVSGARQLVHVSGGAVTLTVDGEMFRLAPGQLALSVRDASGEVTTWILSEVALSTLLPADRAFVESQAGAFFRVALAAVEANILPASALATLRTQLLAMGISLPSLPSLPGVLETLPPDVPGDDVNVISPS